MHERNKGLDENPLAEFALARMAEEAEVAKRCLGKETLDDPLAAVPPPFGNHYARHHPALDHADVLSRMEIIHAREAFVEAGNTTAVKTLDAVITRLALRWASHEDFDAAWEKGRTPFTSLKGGSPPLHAHTPA